MKNKNLLWIQANKKKYFFIILHIIFPLVLGALIYISFRSKRLLVFKWIEFIGMSKTVIKYRKFLNPLKSILPNFILFSVPDGLWLYGYINYFGIVWKNNKRIYVIFIIIGNILSIFVEILQKFRFFPGTYCNEDIYFYIIFEIVALINVGRFLENEKSNNDIDR